MKFAKHHVQSLALALLATTCSNTIAAPSQHTASYDTVADALVAAKAAHEPVLIDFSALWCHGCWWMKANVMNGPQWEGLMKRMIYVESDTDLPDGAEWMAKLKVPGLPTYVVLNADAQELGRIVGSVKREEFYPKINRYVKGADTLVALESKAANGAPSDVAEVLDVFNARSDHTNAYAWYQALPESLRQRADKNSKVVFDLESMRMGDAQLALRAEKADAARTRLAESCVGHGQAAIAAAPTYDDRVELIADMKECSDGMDAARRRAILAEPVALATAQLEAEKLSRHPLPPGTRDAVWYLADATKALGEKQAAEALCARGIAAYRKELDDGKGGLDLKKDRSAAENLYALYRLQDNKDQVRTLVEQLAKTFDEDSNYALSYGAMLVRENHPEQALPVLEHAAELAHGRYVLRVANQRAKALIALSRAADAEKVAADALRASGSAFPKDQEALKKTVSGIEKNSVGAS